MFFFGLTGDSKSRCGNFSCKQPENKHKALLAIKSVTTSEYYAKEATNYTYMRRQGWVPGKCNLWTLKSEFYNFQIFLFFKKMYKNYSQLVGLTKAGGQPDLVHGYTTQSCSTSYSSIWGRGKHKLNKTLALSSNFSNKGVFPTEPVSLPLHCFETGSLEALLSKNARRRQAKGG